MSPVWGDLVARSRGLATHLLSRDAFARLLRHGGDPVGLAEALARHPDYRAAGGAGEPAGIEAWARAVAGRRLALLARWAGPRAGVLAVVFEDEDRRSVRQLLRGAAQGAAPGRRLTGLIPTPLLPAGALEELAALDSARAVAGLLAVWGNPYAAGLLPAVAGPTPDLFRAEAAVALTFGRRASRGAGRGGRTLRRHVARLIDAENAWTVLALGGGELDRPEREALFVPGGEVLTRARFEEAAAAGDGALARLLDWTSGDVALQRSLEAAPARREGAWLSARLTELAHIARLEPLGPAPVLRYALAVRAEVMNLGMIAWAAALGAPADTLERRLVAA